MAEKTKNKKKSVKLKLKPSMRENKRYLLVDSTNKKKIEKSLRDYLGIKEFSRLGLSFLNINDRPVLAINREKLYDSRAALCLAGIRTLKVSGTLKKLKER